MGIRRASFPSSSSEQILKQVDAPKRAVSWVKHGKYVLLGSMGVWWSGVQGEVQRLLAREDGWIRKTLVAGLALHCMTVVIFLYLVVFLPRIRGYIPNYPKWQQSARLRVLVPFLTATILLGWTCYVVAISQGGSAILPKLAEMVDEQLSSQSGESGIGVWKAIAGTTAMYILTLGLLGFIPVPKGVPVRKKEN